MRAFCFSLVAAFLVCLTTGCGSEPVEVMPEPTAEEEAALNESEMENEALMEDPSER